MKIWLTLCTSILLSACHSARSPDPAGEFISKNSMIPLTLTEAQNSACDLKDGDSSDVCVCIKTKLFELGQNQVFQSYISNEIKCGTSENARQRAIDFLKFDAIAICNNYTRCYPHGWASKSQDCPLYMTCWDGTVPDPRNPCEQYCPVVPSMTPK